MKITQSFVDIPHLRGGENRVRIEAPTAGKSLGSTVSVGRNANMRGTCAHKQEIGAMRGKHARESKAQQNLIETIQENAEFMIEVVVNFILGPSFNSFAFLPWVR